MSRRRWYGVGACLRLARGRRLGRIRGRRRCRRLGLDGRHGVRRRGGCGIGLGGLGRGGSGRAAGRAKADLFEQAFKQKLSLELLLK